MSDLLYVLLFAVAWPLYDYFVDWPRFLRWLREAPHRARRREYAGIVVVEWLVVAAGATLWARAGRPWSSLGLQAPGGWRLWVSAAVLLLIAATCAAQALKVARNQRARIALRRALAPHEPLLPHTGADLAWFVVVSVTAGVCEEFLFRGYCIRALSPWLGWWSAAALAVAAFGFLHAYQGGKGILRSGAVGAVMTLVVVGARSLYPAMVLHALIDVGSGVVGWLVLNETPPAIGGVGA